MAWLKLPVSPIFFMAFWDILEAKVMGQIFDETVKLDVLVSLSKYNN